MLEEDLNLITGRTINKMRDLLASAKCTTNIPDGHVTCVIGVIDTEERICNIRPTLYFTRQNRFTHLVTENVGCSHMASTSSIFVIHITALLFSLKQWHSGA